MTESEIAIATALRAQGIPYANVAKVLKKHRVTISNALRKRKLPITPSIPELSANWKDELKGKSIETLRAALTPEQKGFETYKAAPIAVSVLKGIGEFREEQQTGITITISPIPRALEQATIDLVPEPDDPAMLCQDNDSRENIPECDGSSQKETE